LLLTSDFSSRQAPGAAARRASEGPTATPSKQLTCARRGAAHWLGAARSLAASAQTPPTPCNELGNEDKAPPLPPSPARRRFSGKLKTATCPAAAHWSALAMGTFTFHCLSLAPLSKPEAVDLLGLRWVGLGWVGLG